METGDGLLVRVRASGGTPHARSGRGDRRGRARLRQRRDRPLGARQSAIARRQREDTCRTCRRVSPRRPHRRGPGGRASAQHRRQPLERHRPDRRVRSRAPRRRARERASPRTRAAPAAARSSASSSMPAGGCRSATSTRTSASRRRATASGRLCGLSRRRRRTRRGLRAAGIAEVAARLAEAFLSLAGADERAADARPRRSRRRNGRLRQSRSRRRPARRSQRSVSPVDVLGAHAFGPRSWSARRRPSATSTRAASSRSSTRAERGRRRAAAHALALLSRDRPRAAGGGVLPRRFGEARLCPRRPAICGFASSPVPARPPACTRIARCARTRRAGRRCCRGRGVILHVSGCAKGCARPFRPRRPDRDRRRL